MGCNPPVVLWQWGEERRLALGACLCSGRWKLIWETEISCTGILLQIQSSPVGRMSALWWFCICGTDLLERQHGAVLAESFLSFISGEKKKKCGRQPRLERKQRWRWGHVEREAYGSKHYREKGELWPSVYIYTVLPSRVPLQTSLETPCGRLTATCTRRHRAERAVSGLPGQPLPAPPYRASTCLLLTRITSSLPSEGPQPSAPIMAVQTKVCSFLLY